VTAAKPFKVCKCCGAIYQTRADFEAGTAFAFVWPAEFTGGLALENRHCLSCPEDNRTTLAVEVQS
jgi:hypothetical protein